MTIAILGGTRFIGFHLAAALAAHGAHHVTLFNRGMTKAPGPLPPGIKVVRGDRDSPADAAKLLSEPFDVLFDLSGETPRHVLPFLTPASRRQVGHYVFCSTSSAYRTPPPCPHTESAPCLNAGGTYGGDKAAVENLLLDCWRRDRWPVTILRPQGVFGPLDGQQAAFVFSRLRASTPIFRSAEAQTRINFLFVHDLIATFVAVVGAEASHGRAYNVAGGDAVTQDEFVQLCGTVAGHHPDIRIVRGWRARYAAIGMPWLPYDLIADTTAVRTDLAIQFTPLVKALAVTLDWWRSQVEDLLRPNLLPAERHLLAGQRVPLRLVAGGLRRSLSTVRALRRIRDFA